MDLRSGSVSLALMSPSKSSTNTRGWRSGSVVTSLCLAFSAFFLAFALFLTLLECLALSIGHQPGLDGFPEFVVLFIELANLQLAVAAMVFPLFCADAMITATTTIAATAKVTTFARNKPYSVRNSKVLLRVIKT